MAGRGAPPRRRLVRRHRRPDAAAVRGQRGHFNPRRAAGHAAVRGRGPGVKGDRA